MQVAPANWNDCFSQSAHTTEYLITISERDGSNPVAYGMDTIKSASIEAALLATDMRIGNAISRLLTMTVLSSVNIPRMAKVVVECRLELNGTRTSYIPVGVFWVDERNKGSLWKTFTCYDAMLMCEQQFIDAELEHGEWPISMSEAVAEICARIGVTLDSRAIINTGADYVVPYTNDLTMREVLGYIAACHGGNWTITPDGKLRLVVLESPSVSTDHVLNQSVKSFYELGDPLTLSKLTMYDDAENAFEAGDETGYHLEIDCPYATASIANVLCNPVNGVLYGTVYTPFEATGARINPLVELGDDVSIGEIASVLNKIDINLNTAFSADISCPGEQEVDHEYPYLSTIQRTNNRTVKLNASYFGTSISRAEGLVIDKLVDENVIAKAIFNSDVFAMRALESGVLKDKIYFDPAKGNYIFNGELSADVINALSAVITPNLYAGKATIAEVTVDQADTSDKVQKYLDADMTDDNFQRIFDQYHDFITAQTDGTATEHVTNRGGEPLYWADDTFTAASETETEWPVLSYVYTEQRKMRVGFMLDPSGSGYQIPVIELGVGTGTDNHAKGYIYKGVAGLYIDYYSSTDGSLRRIILGDDGIILTPYALESLDFYANGFRAVYSGETVAMTYEKDGGGRITQLITEDMEVIPVGWHAGDM